MPDAPEALLLLGERDLSLRGVVGCLSSIERGSLSRSVLGCVVRPVEVEGIDATVESSTTMLVDVVVMSCRGIVLPDDPFLGGESEGVGEIKCAEV